MFDDLTYFEAQVLYWRCRGSQFREIAERLSVEYNALQAIVSNVYAKLNLPVDRETSPTRRRIILRDVTASLFVSALALAGGRKTWTLLKADSQGQAGGPEQEVMIPYGIAIFLGLCLAAFVVHV